MIWAVRLAEVTVIALVFWLIVEVVKEMSGPLSENEEDETFH